MATKIETPITDTTWVQVVDSAYLMSRDGTRQLKLSWKAATSKIAEIVDDIFVGQALSSTNSVISAAFQNVDDAGMRISWSNPSGYVWTVAGSEVRQLEAGEYSVMSLIYNANPDYVEPGAPSTKVLQDTVSLQWQTYSVSPYRYCNELEHKDGIVDQNGNPIPSTLSGSAACSMREHIEECITQNAADKSLNRFQYKTGNNVTAVLTKAEQLIWEKVAAGTNPVFHYPIVQHTRVVETNLSSMPSGYGPEITAGVDIIASLPQEVEGKISDALAPWTALSGQFVYCGQAASFDSKTTDIAMGQKETIYTWTFVDTYEGALSADQNFYGTNFDPAQPNGRWQFGVGPQPQDQNSN